MGLALTDSTSNADDVVGLLSELLELDVADATESELGRACRAIRRVRGYVDAVEAAVARRSEELHRAGCGRGAAAMLARNGRLSGKEARRSLTRAEALAEAPALGAALAQGAVSAGHVDAYADVTRRAEPSGRAALVEREASLAGLAVTQTPEDFARSCQRVVALADDDGEARSLDRQRRAARLRRWVDHATGMYRLAGELDPELGVRVWRAVDHVVATEYPPDRRPATTPEGPDAADHLAALALADLATAAMAETLAPDERIAVRPASRRPPRGEFTVVVDVATLVGGLHERSIVEVDPGGVTLPMETLRRLACEADLLPAVLDGQGVTLDVGRSRRLATADQRRALRAMYPTCAIHGCTSHFDRCEVHHLDPFGGQRGGGRTDLARLVPLCREHHHAAHEGRWRLDLDERTRRLTVTMPDGTVDTHPPPRARPDG